MGALFLRKAAVLLRYACNIALALSCHDNLGMQGTLIYAGRFRLKLSAVEIAVFGLFCLTVALAGECWFYLGGGLACLLLGFNHWIVSQKAHKSSVMSGHA
jgi:hypothetical protein